MRRRQWVTTAGAVIGALALCQVAAGNQSNGLIDISRDGRWLLVANSDNGSVTVVDLDAQKVVREIPVGDKPEGVTWIGPGPMALVTLFREDAVVFVDTRSGTIVERLPVADEPYGVVANRAGTRAWVTHDYPGTVSEIDVIDRRVLRTFTVAPYLRGIALREKENRLYVAGYYDGILYAIDLKTGQIADRWKGHSRDNLCRTVVLHPRRAKAYLPHIRSRVEVADGSGSIFPHLSIADLNSKAADRRRSIALDTFNDVAVPTNPWDAVLSPDGKRFYVIYAGTNEANVCTVIDDDYFELERIGRLRPVGRNPRAIRLSPDGKRVYVANTLDFEIGIYEPETLRRLGGIRVCDPPKTPAWVRGKELFNTALPPMTRRRWIACSSCHPDGHHDGRVWQNPEGLRRTTALFGLAHTHPLHWSADRDEVQDFEYTIRGRLMRGRGLVRGSIRPKVGHEPVELQEKLARRSADLDALAVYSNSFEFTLSPHALGPGKLSEAAKRGQAIFFSDATGCAQCHCGPYYTDSRLVKPFRRHDVGTGDSDPTEKMGPAYDTPTLLGVYRQRFYLHHGKARTLREVLTTFNRGDRHGKTSHLRPSEIDDLIEFLKSLPYEPPPVQTANTVADRVPPKAP